MKRSKIPSGEIALPGVVKRVEGEIMKLVISSLRMGVAFEVAPRLDKGEYLGGV